MVQYARRMEDGIHLSFETPDSGGDNLISVNYNWTNEDNGTIGMYYSDTFLK